jgi:hypothetical protein
MSKVTANIRMYRLIELGDSFLVTFTSGNSSSRLLIDCGSFRNGQPSIDGLKKTAVTIKQDLGGKPLNVVVGTHQHNDHVSGFVHCEQAFRNMNIQQVWLSWLDDPADPKAKKIGADFHNLKSRLVAVRNSLAGRAAASSKARESLEVMNDMLGFFGAAAAGSAPDLPVRGVKILKELGGANTKYLRPGGILEMPGLPVGTVRIHVLGPPRKENVPDKDDPLFRKDPRVGESYDSHLAAAGLHADRLLSAAGIADTPSREELHYPFSGRFKRSAETLDTEPLKRTVAHYNKSQPWRKIDDDWTQQAGSLALFLDTFTNNSSLVLAIELVKSGKVLLFAADAQTGNWLSWRDIKWEKPGVKTDDLLARTVFYKVGHHASHNATLVETFEKMNHSDLVALIPVHKKDPNITKQKGWKMPAVKLFKRVKEKTKNRVLQMDNDNPSDCDPTKAPAKAAWAAVGIKPKINPNSIELEIPG